jgi:hypothetical protein
MKTRSLSFLSDYLQSRKGIHSINYQKFTDIFTFLQKDKNLFKYFNPFKIFHLFVILKGVQNKLFYKTGRKFLKEKIVFKAFLLNKKKNYFYSKQISHFVKYLKRFKNLSNNIIKTNINYSVINSSQFLVEKFFKHLNSTKKNLKKIKKGKQFSIKKKLFLKQISKSKNYFIKKRKRDYYCLRRGLLFVEKFPQKILNLSGKLELTQQKLKVNSFFSSKIKKKLFFFYTFISKIKKYTFN